MPRDKTSARFPGFIVKEYCARIDDDDNSFLVRQIADTLVDTFQNAPVSNAASLYDGSS